MTKYESLTLEYGSIHKNRCIDGRITGQSCCVGYCNYHGHKGFLTERLRKQHNCINKGCYYYVPKEKTNIVVSQNKNTDETLTERIARRIAPFEGMKVVRVFRMQNNEWKINYITVSNDYPIMEVSKELEKETGYTLAWNRLNYDFETVAKMIFA